MLSVSAAMLVSSTFAWFTMNKSVKATSMQVQAVAEDGLLINEIATATDTNWDNVATAAQTAESAVKLHPSSTADGSTWYHAESTKANDAAAATESKKSANLVGDYTTLSGLKAITSMSASASAGSTAFRETMGTSATADAGYYVHYTYYLKSSSGTAVTLDGTNRFLNIKEVKATLPGTQTSAALNPSIRVGIKLNQEFYIYAPVTGYTASYYVAAGDTATAPIAGNTVTKTDLDSLPANGTDGTPVEVYIWYEGEDAGCKSDNARATALDNINIDITFSLVTPDLPAA